MRNGKRLVGVLVLLLAVRSGVARAQAISPLASGAESGPRGTMTAAPAIPPGYPVAGAPLPGQYPIALTGQRGHQPCPPPLPPSAPVWHEPVPGDCADGHPEHFTPYMLGDFVGIVANLFSDVKIAEGESPRPIDRVFYKFNYYNNLEPTRFRQPTEEIERADLYRNVFGFEKTFLNRQISVGVRVPFNTIAVETREAFLVPLPGGAAAAVPGSGDFTATHLGNVSAIAKGILWEDRETGSLLSAGATLSIPTASTQKINPGQSTLSFVQPFVGFILSRGDLFVQGFTSVTAPVARPQSIVFFGDVGVGYYLYRDVSGSRLLTAVAPTFEVHVASPLRQADPAVSLFGIVDDLKLHNVVDLTLGSTLEFSNRATLGVGVAVPVTAPRPFDIEGLAQLNWRF